jgi:hypothetical protein
MGRPGPGGILEDPMKQPTADEQIQFLVKIQRLLEEGQFRRRATSSLKSQLFEMCLL